MVWICLTAYFVFLSYFILIAFFTAGWFRKSIFIPVSFEPLISVSVIVAFRNEEKHISNLINCLKKQTYPKTEYIFVDDHSNDNTVQIIQNSGLSNCRVFRLPENQSGKKQALRLGIESATGSLIVQTDGDCMAGEKWIETIASFHQNEKIDFILAPVKQSTRNSFLEKLFSIDFLSLQASGAGAAEIQLPFICNGANMAFTKTFWKENHSDINDLYASGDDVFLLHKAIEKISPEKIKFLFSSDAIINTPAPSSITEFFHQRVRWAGKSKGYKNKMAIVSAFIVFALTTVMVLMMILSAFSKTIFYCFIVMIFTKTIIELPLMFSAARFYKEDGILKYFLPGQLFYFLYTFLIAFVSLFMRPKWKERKINV